MGVYKEGYRKKKKILQHKGRRAIMHSELYTCVCSFVHYESYIIHGYYIYGLDRLLDRVCSFFQVVNQVCLDIMTVD